MTATTAGPGSTLAVLVALLICVSWSMTAVCYFWASSEYRARLRAERARDAARAKLREHQQSTRSSWAVRAPKRPHQVVIPATPTQTNDTKEHPMVTTTRRRFLPAAITAAAVALLAAGCWNATPPPGLAPTSNPASPSPAEVVEFGDSLSAWGKTTIQSRWVTAHPDLSLSYNAVAGAEAANWMPWMADVVPGQCAIVALGTNEVSRLTANQAEWQALGALNELADADVVVWFTLNSTSAKLRGPDFYAKTTAYNGFLRQLYTDGTYPNLVVVDWDALSKGHTEWLAPDQLHHNPDGDAAYGDAYADAGTWCP